MFKQIWKYVWLMVVMSMVLAACATPQPLHTLWSPKW